MHISLTLALTVILFRLGIGDVQSTDYLLVRLMAPLQIGGWLSVNSA